MRVLLTGATGQLGQALRASCPPQLAGRPLELIATSRSGGDGLLTLNLADAEACRAAVYALRPDWVLNAGAYTAVDQAESHVELAYAVNAEAPAALAQALVHTGGHLLQLSTDFVFNGRQGHPYRPEQPPDPLGVYGASKAAGEAISKDLLAAQCCILRTSWVYGPLGRNFLLTMLRLHRERDQMAVVADQVGCPTATLSLAQACWRCIERGLSGVHHWSDAGVASWYDFAVAIGELAAACGLVEHPSIVRPITTADFPTPACRPSYSLLDCTITRAALELPGQHWRVALAQVLRSIAGPIT